MVSLCRSFLYSLHLLQGEVPVMGCSPSGAVPVWSSPGLQFKNCSITGFFPWSVVLKGQITSVCYPHWAEFPTRQPVSGSLLHLLWLHSDHIDVLLCPVFHGLHVEICFAWCPMGYRQTASWAAGKLLFCAWSTSYPSFALTLVSAEQCVSVLTPHMTASWLFFILPYMCYHRCTSSITHWLSFDQWWVPFGAGTCLCLAWGSPCSLLTEPTHAAPFCYPHLAMLTPFKKVIER